MQCYVHVQMWSIFDNYYSYETATSVNMGYGKMPLPSITFCNVNPIRESKLLAHEDSADITNTYKDIVDRNHGQVAKIFRYLLYN